MKTILTSLAAVVALSAVAAPALAQPYAPRHDQGRYDQGRNDQGRHNQAWTSINQRQGQLDRRIDQGVRQGDLSRREAQRLRNEFRDIARLENRYRSNGLTFRERADLDRRFDRLSAQIRAERRDRDGRRG